jgi:1-phosphatidylinositol phosphodiesterase
MPLARFTPVMTPTAPAWARRFGACMLVGLAFLLPGASPVHAQVGSSFWNNESEPNKPAGNVFRQDWMGQLRDDVRLRELSIPGTHDSMTYDGRIKYKWLSKTQSMSLRAQLDAGIRALDIRLKRGRDDPSALLAFHGPIYLHFNFNDILRTVNQFLAEFPTETVLMRIKDEEDSDKRDPGLFALNVRGYFNLRDSKVLAGVPDPTLGQARGHIVVLDDFSPSGNTSITGLGIRWDGPAGFNIQDMWEVRKGPDGINDKWPPVVNHVDYARTHPGDAFFVNFLSASGYKGGTPPSSDPSDYKKKIGPSFYAYGQGRYNGINMLFYDHVARLGEVPFVGIVYADFPGSSLIGQIVNISNPAYRTWTRIPGLAKAVATSRFGSWALGWTPGPDGNHPVFFWSNARNDWQAMGVAGVRIGADDTGGVWVVNKSNELWNYGTRLGEWVKHSDNATDIAIGAGELWKVGAEPEGTSGNAVYRWSKRQWQKVQGASAVALAIEGPPAGAPPGYGGAVWLLDKAGALQKRFTRDDRVYRVAGQAVAIGAAGPHVFVIGPDGSILKWQYSKRRVGGAELGEWNKSSGTAAQIAVRPDGVLLISDNSGAIFVGSP